MKNQNYHTVGTVQSSNRKILERVKINTPNTQIHDRSLSSLGSYTSITSVGGGGGMLFLLDDTNQPSWVTQKLSCI